MANLTGLVWLNYVIVAFIAVNVLVLFGRLFSRYSAETLAFVLSLAVAGPVGYFAYGASESFAVAAGLVVVLGSLVGGVFAPLFYIAARNVFTGITPVLAPVFDKIFDGLWQLYVSIWSWLRSVIAAVLTWLAPVLLLVRGVWSSIAQSLSKIFG